MADRVFVHRGAFVHPRPQATQSSHMEGYRRTAAELRKPSDDMDLLDPEQQKRLRHFLNMGLSAVRIGRLMALPVAIVGSIKTRGAW